MNKKLKTALICGTFVTTSASLIAETGLKQHDGMTENTESKSSRSIDYPVRDDATTHMTEYDDSKNTSANTNSFEWQSSQRLESWENVIGLNRARYERSGKKDVKAEKTMSEMESNLKHWRLSQEKFTNSSDEERAKVATDITSMDKEMAQKQNEFDRQVPRDSVDYKSELKSTISQIESAEKDIDNQLAFLNQREELLEEIKEELDEVKEEASEHLAEIEDMDKDSEWAELKSDIDSWMNENLNLEG